MLGVLSLRDLMLDIFFDWALGKPNLSHPYLRKSLAFPVWVYYFGIIMNLPLRFSWAILLSPGFWHVSPLTIFLLAIIEVFRRAFWVLLRLESENSLNVGKFRISVDLPLPFAVIED